MKPYSVWKHNYDDEWIRQNYPGKCTNEFHRRYISETGHEVCKESLRKHIRRDLDLDTKYHYTDEELAFVEANYALLGGKACSEILGIPITRVYGIARAHLGIKMSEEDFRRHVNVYEAQYPIGTIKRKEGDSNYCIKAEDGWHELGRYVWEQHYGKIPEGHYVVFLNRDPSDARIENLALVPKGVVGAMNLNDMWHEDSELTKTQIMVILLERAMKGQDNGI